MKIRVTNRSIELKLTLEDCDNLQGIVDTVRFKILVDSAMKNRADILSKKLRDAREAASKLNWMDGM